MAAPATIDELLELVRKSGVADEKRLETHVGKLRAADTLPTEPSKLAGVLVRDGLLTHFQAEHLMQGKWRRFTIGKYKVLEKLGSGGMGQVYLCEHKLMRRRVAVKVLPSAKAKDDSAKERFYREARAVAALDHPNIVHAYDIDQDDELHFLVMEFVDGANLQEIVKRGGPLDVTRACHYVRQAALGLEHAHQAARLVHRDIKPGNILVDRTGVVKILDMGLARFFLDEEDLLTKKYDENVLGTADYLAPEQALDSHAVDIRADIYSLGATFYFMLTGKTPFGEGTVAQKLIWHQSRQPKTVAEHRRDVPAGVQAVITKMMAKEPGQRYQVPGEIVEALSEFTQTEIGPPPEKEMPQLSPAALGMPTEQTGGSTAISKTSPTPPIKAATAPPSPPVKAAVPPSPPASKPAPPRPAAPAPVPKPAPSPASPLGTSGKARQPVKSSPSPLAAGAQVRATTPMQPSPVVVATPIPTPTPDDEEIPWEKLAADTEDPDAKGDTTPQSIRSPKHLLTADVKAKTQERRRLKLVIAAIAAPFVLIVLFLLWKFVFTGSGTTTPLRTALMVSKDNPKAFRTIKQALRSAQQGDVIELHDEVHEETLAVDPSQGPTDVTLQAAAGKEVRWIPAQKGDVKSPLLTLTKAAGFTLKGRGLTLAGTLDKNRRVNDVVFVTSFSRGLTIENATLEGFSGAGVRIMNAKGEKDRLIRLLHLTFAMRPDSKTAYGVHFDANPDVQPQFNDNIEIGGCLFHGLAEDNHVNYKDNTVKGTNIVVHK